MAFKYIIVLLVALFVLSTNATKLRASSYQRNVDDEANNDPSTSETPNEFETRMNVLEPDTKETPTAKLDRHCSKALKSYTECNLLYKNNLQKKRKHCSAKGVEYTQCRKYACKEEREEVVSCIKNGAKLSKKNVTKWLTEQRGKCGILLQSYNVCRKVLAMPAVILPMNPFHNKRKNIKLLTNLKNPIAEHSREDDADYILDSQHNNEEATEKGAEEENEVNNSTNKDYQINVDQEPKTMKKISNNYRHEYAKEIRACHSNPLTKWCRVTSLCISIRRKCFSNTIYGPNHNEEDNSKYNHSNAFKLLKQFKKVHQLLTDEVAEGDAKVGKIPAHLDNEDNSKLLSKPGIKLAEHLDPEKENILSIRSFRPANLNDSKFSAEWKDHHERWVKVPLKDGKYRWWEPKLDKYLPINTNISSYKGFKLLEDTTSTGYVNTIIIGSSHGSSSKNARKKPKMVLPNITYQMDKRLLSMGQRYYLLDRAFDATLKKYQNDSSISKQIVQPNTGAFQEYEDELIDAIRALKEERKSYNIEKSVFKIKYGGVLKKRGEDGYDFLIHEKLNLAEDRVKDAQNVVKNVQEKIQKRVSEPLRRKIQHDVEKIFSHNISAKSTN